MSVFAVIPGLVSNAAGATIETLERIAPGAGDVVGRQLPNIMASTMQTLDITLDTSMLFEGANLIVAALGSVFLFIAGLALGARILGAIVGAIQGLKF